MTPLIAQALEYAAKQVPPSIRGKFASADEYLSARRDLSGQVRIELTRRFTSARLLGSWRSGEFHLGFHSGDVLSDVDAYDPTLNSHRVTHMVITGTHLGALTLRLSVHTHDYVAAMSVQAQKLLAIINLAAGLRQNDRSLRQYILAKSILILSSRAPEQTYADTAVRLGDPGLSWFNEKVGLIEGVAKVTDISTFDQVKLDEALQSAYRKAICPDNRVSSVKSSLADALNSKDLYISDEFRSYLHLKIDKIGD